MSRAYEHEYALAPSFHDRKAALPVNHEVVQREALAHVYATDRQDRAFRALAANVLKAEWLRAAGRPVPAELTQDIQHCRDALIAALA